jgi:uncharacterized coiled-coil DUF342 family protein
MSEDGMAKETTDMLLKQLKFTWKKISKNIEDKRPHLYEEIRELLRAIDDGEVTPPDREEVREALRTLKCELQEKKPDPESIGKAIEFLMGPGDDFF